MWGGVPFVFGSANMSLFRVSSIVRVRAYVCACVFDVLLPTGAASTSFV